MARGVLGHVRRGRRRAADFRNRQVRSDRVVAGKAPARSVHAVLPAFRRVAGYSEGDGASAAATVRETVSLARHRKLGAAEKLPAYHSSAGSGAQNNATGYPSHNRRAANARRISGTAKGDYRFRRETGGRGTGSARLRERSRHEPPFRNRACHHLRIMDRRLRPARCREPVAGIALHLPQRFGARRNRPGWRNAHGGYGTRERDRRGHRSTGERCRPVQQAFKRSAEATPAELGRLRQGCAGRDRTWRVHVRAAGLRPGRCSTAATCGAGHLE